MKKIGIIIAIVALCFAGCSKDKVDDLGGGPIGTPTAGAPFTYHFKIEEGANAGYEISGEVPNDDAISMYFSENGNAEKGITFLMQNDDIGMNGIFQTDSSGNVLDDIDPEVWNVTMYTLNKSFALISANINVSNIYYSGLPQTGYAAFKLEFDGMFHQNIDESDIYKISGTIVTNPPSM